MNLTFKDGQFYHQGTGSVKVPNAFDLVFTNLPVSVEEALKQYGFVLHPTDTKDVYQVIMLGNKASSTDLPQITHWEENDADVRDPAEDMDIEDWTDNPEGGRF